MGDIRSADPKQQKGYKRRKQLYKACDDYYGAVLFRHQADGHGDRKQTEDKPGAFQPNIQGRNGELAEEISERYPNAKGGRISHAKRRYRYPNSKKGRISGHFCFFTRVQKLLWLLPNGVRKKL